MLSGMPRLAPERVPLAEQQGHPHRVGAPRRARARADSVNARPRLCSPASRAAAAASSSTRTWSAPMRSAASGTWSHSSRTRASSISRSACATERRRLHGRLPGADQRPGRVVGRVPVVRLLHVGPPVADQRRVGVDRERELGVHLAVLAGQQVLVHGLADQRVPERVPVGGGHQHVAGDGGPDRGGQLVLGPAGDPGEQRVAGGAAAGAGDAEHLLGVLRQPPHRLLEQVGQRVGDQRRSRPGRPAVPR